MSIFWFWECHFLCLNGGVLLHRVHELGRFYISDLINTLIFLYQPIPYFNLLKSCLMGTEAVHYILCKSFGDI